MSRCLLTEGVPDRGEQRLGCTPEGHRRRFRGLTFEEAGRPFSYAQQLLDAAGRWLQPGHNSAEDVVGQVVLEQFIAGLPTSTANWVQCHCPGDIQQAIILAEDHLSLPRRSQKEEARQQSIPAGRPIPAQRKRVPPAPPSGTAPPAGLMNERAEAVPRGPAYASGRPAPWGAPQTPGQECWRCGQSGHFQRECPLMEVGQLVRVAGPPTSSHGRGETYHIPVCIQVGTHQALLDTGCNQTMIHQRLVRTGALMEASWVKVRCVHGDIHEYPVVTLLISYKGKKHRVEAGVSPRLTLPLILGTDWPGFRGQARARSRAVGKCELCAVLTGETEPETVEGAAGVVEPRPEAPLIPPVSPMDDFPLEQSRDETLRHAFDQVVSIDGSAVCPNAAHTHPHFSVIRDRLYRVSRDTQTGEEITQLLVPKSRREMVFQAAHYNPMSGHRKKS
ncbi:uncharacterized protein [Paralichthys olivaceus]|uniref:uncharacterized protein n=1 Tax=Paralichthys olivaceus TaxID=8255 RepID=UPI00375356F5